MSYCFPEMLPLALWRKLRRALSGRAVEGDGDLEFPDLSRPVDQGLYLAGRATLALRRMTPFGTSLLALARRSV